MFCNSNNSISIENDNNTLTNDSFISYNNETIISSQFWTLMLKPPTYNDALNFINKTKNIYYNKKNNVKYNNVIENIRKDLLSLTIPVGYNLNFFASENNIILEPLKQPPSYLMAFKWLETYNLKNKYRKKTLQNNKRKNFMTPESITKSILVKKKHYTSTPNFSNSKLYASPYTPIQKEYTRKNVKTRRKLSTLFLNTLNVIIFF